MMIEEVRAIIAHLTFLDPVSSLAARVIENLAENVPTEVNFFYSFVIYRDKAAKFGKIM